MNPKSGQAGSAVAPAAPSAPLEADNAEPGQMAELRQQQVVETPHRTDENKTSWIEIELVDEVDQPVPGERYKITLPDGSVASGTLDNDGFARVDGIDPGTCQVTFPMLDKDAWKPA